MRTIFIALATLVLTIIAGEAFSKDNPVSHSTSDDPGTTPKDDPAAKEKLEDAVYCTLLCSEKLVADLHMTAKQTTELVKLQEQLKATVLNGAVHAQQHGAPTGKARTLVKMTEYRLTYIGDKIKELLTPEQDQTLNEFYSSGKLRPIEVAASEVHDPKHGTKGKSFGQIVLVPHYDDAPTRSEGTASQGAMHGAHSEGSYYRDSTSQKLGGASKTEKGASKTEKKENASSDDDIDTLLANLKKAGHDPAKVSSALRPIEQRLPREPNPAMAEALENVLLENATNYIRISAARSLENWGRPESIPALKKAAKSTDHYVAVAAEKAIKALTISSTPESETNDAEKSTEKSTGKSSSSNLTKRHARRQPQPMKAADRDKALAEIQSADATKRKFAFLRIVGKKPEQPDDEMTKTLEQVLSQDESAEMRGFAAWALQNWGTAASIPLLKKALNDSDAMVRLQSKKAIETISSGE